MSKFIEFLLKKTVRVVVGVSIPIFGILGALYLYNMEGHIPCIFQTVTQLHCPGCGAARASRSLLHLDILKALNYNPLFVIFLPVGAYFMLKQYIRYVFSKDVLPMFKVNRLTAIIILIIIVAFGILRNIPLYPFTILAP